MDDYRFRIINTCLTACCWKVIKMIGLILETTDKIFNTAIVLDGYVITLWQIFIYTSLISIMGYFIARSMK